MKAEARLGFVLLGELTEKYLDKKITTASVKEIKNLTFDSSMNKRFSNGQKFLIGANCNFYCCLIDRILGFCPHCYRNCFTLPPQFSLHGAKISASFKEEKKVSIVKSHQAKFLIYTHSATFQVQPGISGRGSHLGSYLQFPRQQKHFFLQVQSISESAMTFHSHTNRGSYMKRTVNREQKRKINMIVLFRV